MTEMLIHTEVKKIDELIPADYNPRKALKKGDPEYARLKESILKFGYVDPIIWNKRSGVVVGGHQRLTVLKDLGYEEVQVSVVDLDIKQEKALNIALNKISGDWEEETLLGLLEELLGDGMFDLTGFEDKELDKLRKKFMENEAEEEKPEVEFTEELLEEHNYLVLYFDNQLDWQVAKDVFNIRSKHALDSREGYERKGVGRVIRGADVLEKIRGEKK